MRVQDKHAQDAAIKTRNVDVISSMRSYYANIEEVTHFVLHIVYNFPKREKSPGDSRYSIHYVVKGEKKSFELDIITTRSNVFIYINIAS